jgi:hypothetical protein
MLYTPVGLFCSCFFYLRFAVICGKKVLDIIKTEKAGARTPNHANRFKSGNQVQTSNYEPALAGPS